MSEVLYEALALVAANVLDVFIILDEWSGGGGPEVCCMRNKTSMICGKGPACRGRLDWLFAFQFSNSDRLLEDFAYCVIRDAM